MNNTKDFFQAGGTLDKDAPSYIKRPADEKLVNALEQGQFCMILAPRQTGKSSLMIQAAGTLENKGIKCGIVDLQQLGGHHAPEPWFGDVIYQVERSLKLETDTLDWWEDKKRLGPTQRFMTFIEDIVLKEIPGKAVIFFDEIDSILPLPFSDDFFTTIRALFNARANNPVLKRISFVFLGVATPSDFIKNKSRTPFNVGKEIELKDFDPSALSPFKQVLGQNCETLAERIFYWTSGQPMMVQKIAETLYSLPHEKRKLKQVDETVQGAFLDAKIDEETHLKFIRDYLVGDSKKAGKVLKSYKSVLKGKSIEYDEQSLIHSRLLLSGVVKVDEDDRLVSRNRVYERIFDEGWIKENTPRDFVKIVAYGASSALVLVLLWFVLIQPLFFPKFVKQQTLSWTDEDIYYTTDLSYNLTLSIPALQVRRITLDDKEIPIELSPKELKENRQIQVSFNPLSPGANHHKVRFYGEFWKENFETKLVIVSFPMKYWQPLDDLDMVKVPGGCFEMGCGELTDECEDNEKPLHRVCLSSFEIGKYEITQEQWEKIMGYNPSYFKQGGKFPVEEISWNDIQEFIKRVNKLTVREYQLPSEAQWEYAARSGGKPEKYAGGNNLNTVGWYRDNSNSKTHSVGQKLSNGLGIYDMSGNVWEWCQDWYDENYYSKNPVNDPVGPEEGSERLLRGGSWNLGAINCRTLYRAMYAPGIKGWNFGFRLVLRLPGQQAQAQETR